MHGAVNSNIQCNSLLRPLEIKTTTLLIAAFACLKWFISSYSIINTKRPPLIGPPFGSPRVVLKEEHVLCMIRMCLLGAEKIPQKQYQQRLIILLTGLSALKRLTRGKCHLIS